MKSPSLNLVFSNTFVNSRKKGCLLDKHKMRHNKFHASLNLLNIKKKIINIVYIK